MKIKYNLLNHLFNFLSVILGVYLAFYFNEEAKASQDRKESRVLLNSLVNDLSNDISTYEQYEIPENIRLQQNVEELLESLLIDSLESIDEQLSAVLGVENYVPTSSTYSSMKSSGKLRLIEDLKLQKMLTNFYDGLVIESDRKGEFQVDYFTNEILAWLVQNFDLLKIEIKDEKQLIILRNKLLIYQSLVDQKVKSYEMIVEDSKQLKAQIESLLNSK